MLLALRQDARGGAVARGAPVAETPGGGVGWQARGWRSHPDSRQFLSTTVLFDEGIHHRFSDGSFPDPHRTATRSADLGFRLPPIGSQELHLRPMLIGADTKRRASLAKRVTPASQQRLLRP
eukprot:scaffold34_cov260-Pinguiococcus_pyrenoidosus.AAC.38